MNKIIVTGGNGFLGKEVVRQLLEINKVEVISPKSSECDFTCKEQTENLFKSIEPDIVIHLAAKVGGIFAIKNNAGSFYYDNMLMGLNIVEASRVYKVNKLVFIGSGCAYPNNGKIPLKEDELWDGYVDENVAPYAIVKKSLTTMLKSYYLQYGLKSISIIPTNLYGPYDHFGSDNNHVIPSLVARIVNAKKLKEKKIVCWGSGNQTRDFLYVSDAANAIIKSVFSEIKEPTVINVGSEKETSIKEVANEIVRLTNSSTEIEWDTSKPEGQPRRLMDISRAKELLNWSPLTSLTEGLKKTLEYYNSIL